MTDVDHRQAAIGAAALVLHEAGCGYDAAHVTGPDPRLGPVCRGGRIVLVITETARGDAVAAAAARARAGMRGT